MKTIRLISTDGTPMGSVSVPDAAVGPDTIRRGDTIFVRKTHDLYVHATCCIVPDGD